MLDGLNSGSLDVLSEFQEGVSANREKGIAGPGGAKASAGDCELFTISSLDKWDSDKFFDPFKVLRCVMKKEVLMNPELQFS